MKEQFVATGAEVTLTKSSGGVFEITINDQLHFSKKQLGHFPTDQEIAQLMIYGTIEKHTVTESGIGS